MCFIDLHFKVDAQWRNKEGGPRRHARGAAFLDKLYVIFLNNYYLFANRKSSYCVAQRPGAKLRKWARHLVYASVYSREYNKDLILMSIMSQLRIAFFFVFA